MAVYGFTSRRAIAGCLYGAIVTGCFYGFSMYSRALKKQFGLSQSQLDNVNTIPYAFGLLSPLFGKLSILLGPRLSILIGGLWCAAWQLVLFLLATRRLVLPSVAPSLSLVVASIFVYNGVQLVSAAVFSTPVVHFPRQRGQAASLVKSFVGLGATVVAQLYVLALGVPDDGPEALDCLLLWACTTLACALFGAACVPAAPDDPPREPVKVVPALFIALLVLGAFSTAVTLLPYGKVHDALVPVMLALALLPMPLALFARNDRAAVRQLSLQHDTPTRADGRPSAMVPPRPAAAAAAPTRTLEAESLSPLQMLRTLDAWLLWYVASVVIGGGTTLTTNFGQILSASGAEGSLTPTCVSLFGACNFLGRLTCMAPSNALVSRGLPRAYFAAIIAVSMLGAHLGFLLALALPAGGGAQSATLLASTSVAGLAFGSMWPHMVVLSSEHFGSRHLSANYMFLDGCSGGAGTLLLANVLPSFIYAAAADASHQCHGERCFGPTHIAIASLSLAAAGAALLLAFRNRPLYQRIASSRLEALLPGGAPE